MFEDVSVESELLMVLILKIAPFVFSILFSVADLSFFDKWGDGWDQYKNHLSDKGDWQNQVWVFHCLSVYINDKSTVVSSVKISLFFVVILHFILSLQQNLPIVLVPVIPFVILALIAEKTATRFYRMDASGRNPMRYEKYYYDDTADIGETDKLAYKRWFLPLSWDRCLSPPRIAIFVDVIIILNVIVLETLLVIFAKDIGISRLPIYAMLFSLLMASFIVLLSYLVFPSGSSRFESVWNRVKRDSNS